MGVACDASAGNDVLFLHTFMLRNRKRTAKEWRNNDIGEVYEGPGDILSSVCDSHTNCRKFASTARLYHKLAFGLTPPIPKEGAKAAAQREFIVSSLSHFLEYPARYEADSPNRRHPARSRQASPVKSSSSSVNPLAHLQTLKTSIAFCFALGRQA